MAKVEEAVLIGLCDGAIDSQQHRTSYITNKIGGRADKLPAISSWQHPHCCLCGGALAHVVQVYCPLAASLYHRNLNVFACPGPRCGGQPQCWRVLRSQCLESEVKNKPVVQSQGHVLAKEVTVANTYWSEGADDWGTDDDEEGGGCYIAQNQPHTVEEDTDPESVLPTGTSSELDVSSSLQDLSLGGGDDIPTFSPFYISVMEETDLVGHAPLEHAELLLKEYEEREGRVMGEVGGSEAGGGHVEERYEKIKPRHGDAAFSRFMKKISVCPEQVLRYSWNGSPLFLTDRPTDLAQVVPNCSRCGGSRGFEFQLMPALVSLLQRADTEVDTKSGLGIENSLEFGTVMVFTCTNSCWSSDTTYPVEEFVYLQADPDQELFK